MVCLTAKLAASMADRGTSEESGPSGLGRAASTVSCFAKSDRQKRNLTPSTIYAWKEKYLQELAKRRHEDKPEVDELPAKKKGRPLMLGAELDKLVELYLKELRSKGAVVNSAIVMAAAEGIVKTKDSNLLAKNGGPILISKDWAKSLMTRMSFVKRRGSTKAKNFVSDFEEHKLQFLLDVRSIIEFEEIPESLIINWDHTGIHYIPVSSWTMEKQGSKRVEISGLDDKRQITAVLGVIMSGYFLPPQIIYTGTTTRCLPKVHFPAGWHITFTDNHWANEITTLQYVDNILLPYVNQKRKELNLATDHSCLSSLIGSRHSVLMLF